MTPDQIKGYELCKAHLERLSSWKEKLDIPNQVHGCGKGSTNTEYELYKIHEKMYKTIINALDECEKETQAKIDKL